MFSRFDPNYLWALIAFSFGALAGYQGIYEVYGPQSKRALTVSPGLIYLFSRGAFPALAFSVLYTYRLVEHFLWIQAAACGAGWELFLRSKWYVKKVAAHGDGFEELYKGPLDIVRWYQNLFLRAIDPRFAREKIEFAKKNLPEDLEYPELCERVLERLNAWSDSELKAKIQQMIEKLSKSYEAEAAKTTGKASKANGGKPEDRLQKQTLRQLNEKFNYRLCHNLVREIGEDSTKTLIETKN